MLLQLAKDVFMNKGGGYSWQRGRKDRVDIEGPAGPMCDMHLAMVSDPYHISLHNSLVPFCHSL